MTQEMLNKLRRSLILHEGYEKFPYVDTANKITIGIGYNLTDRGMDDEWINQQFLKDVNFFFDKLNSDFYWFKDLNEDRQIVLIDMCFMGYKHFLSFRKMLIALSKGLYAIAAAEMLESKWATQVGERATVLALAMQKGFYDV